MWTLVLDVERHDPLPKMWTQWPNRQNSLADEEVGKSRGHVGEWPAGLGGWPESGSPAGRGRSLGSPAYHGSPEMCLPRSSPLLPAPPRSSTPHFPLQPRNRSTRRAPRRACKASSHESASRYLAIHHAGHRIIRGDPSPTHGPAPDARHWRRLEGPGLCARRQVVNQRCRCGGCRAG